MNFGQYAVCAIAVLTVIAIATVSILLIVALAVKAYDKCVEIYERIKKKTYRFSYFKDINFIENGKYKKFSVGSVNNCYVSSRSVLSAIRKFYKLNGVNVPILITNIEYVNPK